MFARGTDNQLYLVWETGQGTGAWGNWGLAAEGLSAVTDPVVTSYTNSNGQSWLALTRDINNQVAYTQRTGPPSAAALAAQRAGGAVPLVTGTLPTPPGAK